MPLLLDLLDQVLELPDGQARRHWLDSLDAAHGRLRPALEVMLAERSATRTTSPLDLTLPIDGLVGATAVRLHPGQTVGPYVLERELGRGGMAEVWLARAAVDPAAEPVALKLPMVSLGSAGFLERLAREREILARLTHPHIARLIDAGITPGGQHYLALAYVDGRPLGQHCDERGLGVRERLALFMQVLDAVRYAHERSVLHRDLKPSNILVTADGQARLLDFGIAKLLVDGQAHETALTEQWGRALTPDYASPEQRAGIAVTVRSDVYALGVILYELLSGRRPGRSRDDALDQPPPPSRAVVAGSAVARAEGGARALSRRLAGDLDEIVLQALQTDPARRHADVGALAAELAQVMAGRRARPLLRRWREQASARWRQQRVVLALGAGCVTVVLLSGRVHGIAAEVEAWLTPSVPPLQQAVLVTIGPDDHRRLFDGRRPLDPAVLQQLVARVLAGAPAVVGVDIDTSPPAFASLRQAFDGASLARVVWGRDVVAQDDPSLPLSPRAVLGAPEVTPPMRAALALTMIDGGSGRVRWYRREADTREGPLPTLGPTLARAAQPEPRIEGAPQAQRGIRFADADRTELPASVVMAPGFDWAGRIRSRIVLIGGRYDAGDMHPTPLGLMHGIDVLAHVVETERAGRGYERPTLAALAAAGLALLVPAALACARFGPWRGLAVAAAAIAAAAAVAALAGVLAAWAYAVPLGLAALVAPVAVGVYRRRGGTTPAWVTAWRRRRSSGGGTTR